MQKTKELEKLFILTFDLEEWFHILDVDSLKTNERWDSFDVRIYRNTDRILEILQKNNLKATFMNTGNALVSYKRT